MFNRLIEIIREVFELEGVILPTIFMALRGFIVYVSTILLIKMNKKFLGVRTPANFALFVMLGSMCAAAITGDAPFLPVTITIVILMLVNKWVSIILFRHPGLEAFFTGNPVLLVSYGNILWHAMEKNHITKDNLLSALQTQLHTNDISKVEAAYLATDGTINFVVKS